MQKWMLINKNSKNKVQLVYDFFCAYKTHPSVRKLLSNYKVLSKKTCSQKSQPPQKKGTTGVLTSTCKGLCAGIASNLCACVHMHLFSGQKKLLKPIKIMNSCYYFNIKPLSENLLNTITNVANWHSWFTAQTLMSKGLIRAPVSLIGPVTLYRSLNLSGPQFLHLRKMEVTASFYRAIKWKKRENYKPTSKP